MTWCRRQPRAPWRLPRVSPGPVALLIVLVFALTFGNNAMAAQTPTPAINWPVAGSKTLPRLRILGPPALRIGGVAGPADLLLVGVVGAVRLPEGGLAIADAGNFRVLFVDGAGKWVATVGREGDGPGEFRLPQWMGWCRDGSLGVVDASPARITFLSPKGTLVGTAPLPAGLEFDLPLRCLGGEEIVLLLNQIRRQIRPGEFIGQPTALARTRTPSGLDTIALRGTQDYYTAKSIGAFSDIPLGRATLAAAGPDLLYLATNDEGEVWVFDMAGAERGRFRARIARRRVSRDDWKRAIEYRIDAQPLLRTRKVLRTVLAELSAPRDFPRIDRIHADAGNNLWVRTFDNFGTTVATWIIVSPDGTPQAVAATPRNLRILEIGMNHLVGVTRDADEVEEVVMYHFAR